MLFGILFFANKDLDRFLEGFSAEQKFSVSDSTRRTMIAYAENLSRSSLVSSKTRVVGVDGVVAAILRKILRGTKTCVSINANASQRGKLWSRILQVPGGV